MKHLLILSTALLIFSACAPSARFGRYTETTYQPTAEVEVFRSKPPGRPYTELGEIRLRIKKSNEDDAIFVLKEKAREIGADAVIILGEEYRGSAIVPVGNMAIAVPKKDLVGIAIRYQR
jgi:hypothetical protein